MKYLAILIGLLVASPAIAERPLPLETFPAAMQRTMISNNDQYLRDELDEIDADDDGIVDASDALAANGANCATGTFPLGVDAAGAAESCTDVITAAELAAATTLHCEPIVVLDPTATSDFVFGPWDYDLELVSWQAILDPADTGESVIASIRECDSTGDNCVTGTRFSVTADNDGEEDTTVTGGDPTVEQDNYLALELGTVTGNPTVDVFSGKLCFELLVDTP